MVASKWSWMASWWTPIACLCVGFWSALALATPPARGAPPARTPPARGTPTRATPPKGRAAGPQVLSEAWWRQLKKQLRSTRLRERYQALVQLIARPEPRARKALFALLTQRDMRLRWWVLVLLREKKLAAPEALLWRQLRAPSPRVRLNAVLLLGRGASAATLARLHKSYAGQSTLLREALCRVFVGEAPKMKLAALLACLLDRAQLVRRTTARAILAPKSRAPAILRQRALWMLRSAGRPSTYQPYFTPTLARRRLRRIRNKLRRTRRSLRKRRDRILWRGFPRAVRCIDQIMKRFSQREKAFYRYQKAFLRDKSGDLVTAKRKYVRVLLAVRHMNAMVREAYRCRASWSLARAYKRYLAPGILFADFPLYLPAPERNSMRLGLRFLHDTHVDVLRDDLYLSYRPPESPPLAGTLWALLFAPFVEISVAQDWRNGWLLSASHRLMGRIVLIEPQFSGLDARLHVLLQYGKKSAKQQNHLFAEATVHVDQNPSEAEGAMLSFAGPRLLVQGRLGAARRWGLTRPRRGWSKETWELTGMLHSLLEKPLAQSSFPLEWAPMLRHRAQFTALTRIFSGWGGLRFDGELTHFLESSLQVPTLQLRSQVVARFGRERTVLFQGRLGVAMVLPIWALGGDPAQGIPSQAWFHPVGTLRFSGRLGRRSPMYWSLTYEHGVGSSLRPRLGYSLVNRLDAQFRLGQPPLLDGLMRGGSSVALGAQIHFHAYPGQAFQQEDSLPIGVVSLYARFGLPISAGWRLILHERLDMVTNTFRQYHTKDSKPGKEEITDFHVRNVIYASVEVSFGG